jgi:hypothetical protein
MQDRGRRFALFGWQWTPCSFPCLFRGPTASLPTPQDPVQLRYLGPVLSFAFFQYQAIAIVSSN